jgi:hypothetical protein
VEHPIIILEVLETMGVNCFINVPNCIEQWVKELLVEVTRENWATDNLKLQTKKKVM